MISRAIVLDSAMSVPTSRPSQRVGPLRGGGAAGIDDEQPARRCGCPSAGGGRRSGASPARWIPTGGSRPCARSPRYDDVPPPAPNTVARPTTLGACQVRLQESMLFDPITCRANFCARKFISLVALEHEKMPKDVVVSLVARPAEALRHAIQRLVPGRRAQLAVVADERGGETAGGHGLFLLQETGDRAHRAPPREAEATRRYPSFDRRCLSYFPAIASRTLPAWRIATDIAIVGAGIFGLATAHALCRDGAGRVTLLDRGLPASGDSGRSFSMVRRHYSNAVTARLAIAGIAHDHATGRTRSAWPTPATSAAATC